MNYRFSKTGTRLSGVSAAGALMLMLAISGCQDHRLPLPGQQIQPTDPKPDYAPTITPPMQAVIEELGWLSPVPLNELSPQQARMQPSFKDAVNSSLDKNNIPRIN
ncbi:hypothetical protein [Spirosoma pollinicola]|uniref:hypothetical protein n=1 Tax=Spirosoma pollinicola TaxID=2057025 RepID=UPI00198074B1|nr:hypothetical protein [Spirosoma pollinicola]